MIIVDFNQVVLSNLLIQLGTHTNAKIEENMVRHMVLNSLRSYVVKFGKKYGEMVIACDAGNIWRKSAFPYYKANRKKGREESDLDWGQIFQTLNKIREEIKEFLPYRVIHVESCEADDVIGTLVYKYKKQVDEILIMSGDKDFIQLHDKNVVQYDPTRKKWVTHKKPEEYLLEHIIRGDTGDGVPNILSADDCLVLGQRQKSMTKKRLDTYMNVGPNQYDPTAARNFVRNQQIIDLKNTPEDLQEKIIKEFRSQEGKNRSKMLNYFIDKKLKLLIEHMGEF